MVSGVSPLLRSSSSRLLEKYPFIPILYTHYQSSIKQSKLLGILPRGWDSFSTIYKLQLLSSDFKNTTVCHTLHEWKYLWKGLLSLLSITYQNNLEKFPFFSIYLHRFCSKPKIHQLMHRLHDANCSHPLAHLDLSLKAIWPSAPAQSGWGSQAKGSTTAWFSHPNVHGCHCLHSSPNCPLKEVRHFVILSLLIFRALSPFLY